MYPMPLNEAERISTLHGLRLLDSKGSGGFDAVAQLVQTSLDAEMSMISLVDERRQWFLASRGVSMAQTPRDLAFCNYPVAQNEPLLVADARLDPRFAANPLVQGGPRVRSYLGCPLHAANGHVIGTLCAADRAPEKFSFTQIPMLQSLSRVVEDLFVGQSHHLALQRATEIDALTGLLNRAAFDRKLSTAIHGRLDHAPVLMMFGLHGVKHLNNAYGHLYGDLALEEIGERLRLLAPPDHAARWAGHVFAILLPDGTGAAMLANDILAAMTQPIRIAEAVLYLRATCGMVRHMPGDKADTMLRRAELALHQGRQRSGRVHLYDPLCEDRERARIAAEAEVYAALESDRIFVGYQPIVDLRDRSIRGYEALMRIAQPNGQVLSAGQLLPALANPDLSRRIATRMTSLVAEEFSRLAHITPGSCYVSLNATEADLLSDDFTPMLLDTLERCAIEPQRVTLEVTETMLVSDLDKVKRVLDELKARGMSIALDDFGTGFSSLTHLKMFPIDKVKIDRSFVKDIHRDHNARAIVAAVIAMARNLSIDVIAEGIEEEIQLALLLHMGCSSGQGYLFSEPRNIAYHQLTWRNSMARSRQCLVQADATLRPDWNQQSAPGGPLLEKACEIILR
jgi:diguanylate cyclase (GGDEF)-like protein